MNIVFMGTPEFSVPTLEMLSESGHTVQAVLTQPDRPRGRGKKLLPTPVKACAEARGIPVYQPLSLRRGDDAAEAMQLLQSLSPDLIVVIAYGQILPKEILELPRYGCINLHASLLPRWRGAKNRFCKGKPPFVRVLPSLYQKEKIDTKPLEILINREGRIEICIKTIPCFSW